MPSKLNPMGLPYGPPSKPASRKVLWHVAANREIAWPRTDPNEDLEVDDTLALLTTSYDDYPADVDWDKQTVESITKRDGDKLHTSYLVKDKPPVVVDRALIPPVTRRQLKLALHRRDLLAPVETTLSALPDPMRKEAEIEYYDATVFVRTHPLVLSIATMLKLAEETVDAVFAEAAAIPS